MTTDTKKEKFTEILDTLEEAACHCGGEMDIIVPSNLVTNEEVIAEVESAISELECFQGTIETTLAKLKELR